MTEEEKSKWHKENSSRDVLMPDGTTENLTLTNWHWAVVDWSIQEMKSSMRRIMEGALEMEWGQTTEKKLQIFLELYVERHLELEEEDKATATPSS